MSRPERLFAGLLVAALAGAGMAYYRAQARQAATLVRITALENRLIASNQQWARAAKNTIAGISEAVRKNHNQARDMAVLRQAQEIQDSTQSLLAKLNQLRQLWQGTDGKLVMGALPTQVDRYVNFIRQFAPKIPSLTKPSAQTAAAGWLGESNMAPEFKPAALAQLTKLETQLRQLAAEVLRYQAQKVGTSWDSFDKIGAFARPASNTVAPGAVYQAHLILVQAASSGRMHFSADGREVPFNPATGQGSVQFSIPAARPGQPDTVRAQWHGRVQMPWGTADTTLATTVPYLIVKPHLP